jgi:hypothetical protein
MHDLLVYSSIISMKRASSLSIFSIMLLVSGLVLLVLAIDSYRKEKHALTFTVPSLTGTYQISYQGRCVLPFRLQEAAIRGGRKVLVGLGSDAPTEDNYLLFNDIGQLYKGALQVQFGDRKVRADLSGVLDIELKLVGDIFQRPFAFDQHLQGPIAIEQGNDEVLIRIPRAAGPQNTAMDQSFPLTIDPRVDQAACDQSFDMLPSLPPFIERLLHTISTEAANS